MDTVGVLQLLNSDEIFLYRIMRRVWGGEWEEYPPPQPILSLWERHRRSQRVHWVHVCTLRAEKKICGPNLLEKVVSALQADSAPTQADQESNF